MNSGAMDALDLDWRLAALHKGYGGELLLRAYNLERRPMMIRALERSLRHLLEHVKLGEMYATHVDLLESDNREGEEVRRQVRQFIDDSGPDTTDLGIELDLRYYDYSPVIYHDSSEEHAYRIYEGRDSVLVRPDTHVAWRGHSAQALNHAQVEEILRVVWDVQRLRGLCLGMGMLMRNSGGLLLSSLICIEGVVVRLLLFLGRCNYPCLIYQHHSY